MRTILLISAAAVLAACSDNQQPTAPRSASSRSSAAGQVAPSTQGIKLPDAKPVDQVGFTKVGQIYTGVVWVNPGEFKWAVATCPDGSTVVGGGYEFSGGNGNKDAPAFISESRPWENTWRVAVSNYATGSQQAGFRAWVLCASSTLTAWMPPSVTGLTTPRGRRLPGWMVPSIRSDDLGPTTSS